MQEQLSRDKVDKMTDFSRLARFLTGTSIGVVLGGGGARYALFPIEPFILSRKNKFAKTRFKQKGCGACWHDQGDD